MTTVNFYGKSGVLYQYEANQIPVPSWNDIPGGYIFSYETAEKRWPVLYVGQAKSYKDRLTNHERWEEAKGRGATHILTHVNSLGEQSRFAEEKDLIASYDPPLNTQHRPQQPSQTLADMLLQKK